MDQYYISDDRPDQTCAAAQLRAAVVPDAGPVAAPDTVLGRPRPLDAWVAALDVE